MQGLFYPVGPGRNSRAEQQDTSRLPIPVMASHGPERDWRPEIEEMVQLSLRNPEQVDPILAEDILNLFEAFRSDESVEEQVDRFKAVLQTSTQDFTLIKRTAIDVMTQIEQEPEAFRLAISRLQMACVLDIIRYKLRISWFVDDSQLEQQFSQQELQENARRYCQEPGPLPPWRSREYLPRFCSTVLVFVHLYSGTRRPGDLQSFLETIEIPASCTRVVLSVDIVFDAQHADLTQEEVQQRWIQFILRGCICAIFAGPPCESWTRSRIAGGVPGFSGGDGGPRMLRTSQSPMGLGSLRIRELRQVEAANILLLFTIMAFQFMVAMHRVMFIEHPSEPNGSTEAWLPSIWRLKVMKIMTVHPAVRRIEVWQGHFKGKSPKPTTFLATAGDLDIHSIVYSCACSELPAALKMGYSKESKEYATASLKEYPPDLCSGLALVVEHWCRKYYHSPTLASTSMPQFLEYTACLRQHLNMDAQRGPDFAS